MKRGARAASLLLVAGAICCASSPAGWDLDALAARYPDASLRGHGLEHTTPTFVPAPDGLVLCLCRWSTQRPVPVWLPPDASPGELRSIEAALAAWERAALGVRFSRGTWHERPPRAGIVFELLEPSAGDARASGSTIADCAIPAEATAGPADAAIDAELRYASIQLQRALRDPLGRLVALDADELAGASVHELGHALGFPGHLPGAGSLMASHGQVDAARRWGRRVLAGERVASPTLAALYALPSGVRVGALPLTREQLAPLRIVAANASRAGLRGPYARVGERSARLVWRDDDPGSAAVVVLGWSEAVLDPARFEARLNRRARRLVESAADR